jgi:hypothetical protein
MWQIFNFHDDKLLIFLSIIFCCSLCSLENSQVIPIRRNKSETHHSPNKERVINVFSFLVSRTTTRLAIEGQES